MALAVERFDTIGIDLIAMNVNDVLCVGAEPIAVVDYIAISTTDRNLLDQFAIGLVEGARQARISIPGGEIAQVRELLRPHPPHGESFDVVATAVGVVPTPSVLIASPCPVPRSSTFAKKPLGSAVLAAQPQALQRLCTLAGGDDYELLFTAAPSQRDAVLAAGRACGVAVTRCGRIEPGSALRLVDATGAVLAPAWTGFDHFA